MDKFWIEQPEILFTKFLYFNPFCKGHLNERLNAFTRLIIITSIILLIRYKKIKILLFGIFLIIFIIIMQPIYKSELFSSPINNKINNLLNEEMLPRRESNFYNTKDLNNNPLKNNTILDYDNKPTSSGASLSDYNTTKYVKGKMFQTSDEYIFDKDTRQFYTMPNTLVPNEQTTFASWLYGSEDNCKAGSIYSHRTGQAPQNSLCTGFDYTGNMTNFGNLNGPN